MNHFRKIKNRLKNLKLVQDKFNILTLLLTIITIIIMMNQFIIVKNNSNLVLQDEVSIAFKGTNTYVATIKKNQGIIDEAYLAYINLSNDGSYNIIYNTLFSSDNKSNGWIKKYFGRKLIFPLEITSNEEYENGNKLVIKDIEQFALVLRDTTGDWNVFYFVVRPGIFPQDLEYKYELNSEDGEKISKSFPVEPDKGESILIYGSLTNIATIEKQLKDLPNEYEYHLFEKPISIKNVVANGDPCLILQYNVPSAEEVYNNLQTIYNDMNLKNNSVNF